MYDILIEIKKIKKLDILNYLDVEKPKKNKNFRIEKAS